MKPSSHNAAPRAHLNFLNPLLLRLRSIQTSIYHIGIADDRRRTHEHWDTRLWVTSVKNAP